MKPHFLRNSAGVTLTELMIAIAVVSIGILGLVAVFGGLQKGIQMAKDKTLASNLAQEKMQIIKQQSYFRVLPTITPSTLSDGTPYDTATFPPESILEGNVNFKRYTNVQVVTETHGVLNILPPTTPDTGLRQITVTITWTERQQTRELSINTLMANPDSIEANSLFTGTVLDAAPPHNPIVGALVNVVENVSWRDTTSAVGAYSIRLSPGSYNLVASAQGYFTGYAYRTVQPDNSTNVAFLLQAMSSGTVNGTAWVNPNVVISQVVMSTVQSNAFDVEYIELFNPTQSTFTMSNGGPINLNIVSNLGSLQCTNIALTYVNSTLNAEHYYLIANTTTFTVNGTTRTADAYYAGPIGAVTASCGGSTPAAWWPNNLSRGIMQRLGANTVYLTDASGKVIDGVGWTSGVFIPAPSHCLGTCISQPANGLPVGDQIVRTSSPTLVSAVYGRAYNSKNNSVDFAYPGASGSLNISGIAYSPNTTSGARPVIISGVPADGAVVSATDGLSSPVTAKSAGSPPAATFSLVNVATGTNFTVIVTSGSYEFEYDTVTIAVSGSVYTFPSSTTLLNNPATAGFVSGKVTDAFGNPISAPSAIWLSGGGASIQTQSSGRYYLRVSTGIVDVTANANFVNPDFISVSSLAISVALGEIHRGINFTLSQGGRLSGWVTRDGVNGLQGVTVTAADSDGNVDDSEVTNVAGNFLTINMATGPYTVSIPLDTTEVSSPTVANATVVFGQTVFVATFTIYGDLGTIAGSVSLGSSTNTISTGVLIVVTTSTLASGPPTLSSATLTTSSYYATSSLEDGSYSVAVRQSTNPAYNIYGYYSIISSTGAVTIKTKSLSNVQVIQGGTVSGQNLQW